MKRCLLKLTSFALLLICNITVNWAVVVALLRVLRAGIPSPEHQFPPDAFLEPSVPQLSELDSTYRKGCGCSLVVLPTGPTRVNAFVGTNVTLGVNYSGVTGPLVTWYMGSVRVAIWIAGYSIPPDIAPAHRGVLSLDHSGSLMFRNVTLNYSHTYTVQMMKPGNSEASVNFTLSVYDSIRDVSLGTGVQDAVEGGAAYELFYSSAPGQAASSEWYFNGLPLADSSRYAITDKSLTIKRPSRNDTGRYGVVLTNPFSSGKQYKDVTVFYGPDQPFLEVSPTKATFVAGETLSLSCRAEGVPAPSATWVYNGHSLPTSPNGTLQLTDVQPSQSGFYTCMLVNVKTSAHLERDVTIEVRGLSTAAIVGLAAGIPCGLLLLILLAGLVLLCVFCYKKKDRNPRYPVSRAVEKAVVSQPDMTKPHKLLISGLKQPPDYRLYDHQGITERAGSLPLATHPMRMATTV